MLAEMSCTKGVLRSPAAFSVFFIATPDYGRPQALHDNRALVSKNDGKPTFSHKVAPVSPL